MAKLLIGASIAIGIAAGATVLAQTAANTAAPAASTAAPAASTAAPAASTAAPAAPAPSSGRLSGADQKFVTDAAIGGMFEVEAGKLAEKSTNPRVRQFGARMVRDHSAADRKLKQIVAAEGGSTPTTLDQEHQQKLEQLGSLHGQDFTRQYMQMMVQDHDADAQDFGKAAQSLNDPQLKQFAAQTLKTIESHDKMAHQIADQTAAR